MFDVQIFDRRIPNDLNACSLELGETKTKTNLYKHIESIKVPINGSCLEFQLQNYWTWVLCKIGFSIFPINGGTPKWMVYKCF